MAALSVATIAANIVCVRLWRPARSLPFQLFALGEGMGFVAGLLQAFWPPSNHGTVPLTMVLVVSAYLTGIAGYGVMIRTRHPGRDRASVIDATVIAVGIGMLSWVFLMAPYANDTSQPMAVRVIAMVYPALDVLILGLVVRLAMSGGERNLAYVLMTGGWLALVASDAARALMLLIHAYDPDSPIEAMWLVSYALWGAAVLRSDMVTLLRPTPTPEVRLTRARLLVLAGASLMAPEVLAIQAALGRQIDVPVIVASCVALFLLVLLRVAGLVRVVEAKAGAAQLARGA